VTPFPRRRDGLHLGLADHERSLLRDLVGQLVTLLEEGDHADPALERLLPPGYAGDQEAEEEFRRLTVDDLTEGKVRNARAVLASLDVDRRTPLDEATEQAWLRSLTDLRLTLAARLGTTAEGVVVPTTDDGRMLHAVYEWLGYLQEVLVRSLSR
jgi:hypothetical protein